MEELNLVPAIKIIEEIISKLDAEHEKKVRPYLNSLEQLRKLNTACEYCNGTGEVLRFRVCAEDDRPDPDNPNDLKRCPKCKGSGKANYEV